MCLGCAWGVPGVCLACAWRVPGVCLACAWCVCAWRVPGVCLTRLARALDVPGVCLGVRLGVVGEPLEQRRPMCRRA